MFITHSGKVFPLMAITADDIRIADIAHSLARQCRFAGHTEDHYSVAQHCVRVAKACPPELMMIGLMHDAPEAYLNDLNGPAKKHCADYKSLEDHVWSVIAFKYDLPLELPTIVKELDRAALHSEMLEQTQAFIGVRAKVLEQRKRDWFGDLPPLPFEEAMDFSTAKCEFLRTFAVAATHLPYKDERLAS